MNVFRSRFCILSLLAGAASIGHSAVLLHVDVARAHLGIVEIYATSASSPGTVYIGGRLGTMLDGINLVDLEDYSGGTTRTFTASTADFSASGLRLSTSPSFTFNEVETGNFGGGSFQDWNIFTYASGSESSTISFVGTAPAFVGGTKYTYSSPMQFPDVGTEGLIFVLGYGVVGEWQIINSAVPEPGSFAAFAGIAALGFAAMRRRR